MLSEYVFQQNRAAGGIKKVLARIRISVEWVSVEWGRVHQWNEFEWNTCTRSSVEWGACTSGVAAPVE